MKHRKTWEPGRISKTKKKKTLHDSFIPHGFTKSISTSSGAELLFLQNKKKGGGDFWASAGHENTSQKKLHRSKSVKILNDMKHTSHSVIRPSSHTWRTHIYQCILVGLCMLRQCSLLSVTPLVPNLFYPTYHSGSTAFVRFILLWCVGVQMTRCRIFCVHPCGLYLCIRPCVCSCQNLHWRTHSIP